MKHDDGGPAYPVSFPSDWHEKHGGMSLLDAFAMKVLPAVYAEKMSEMKKNDFAPADWRNVVIADIIRHTYQIGGYITTTRPLPKGGAK